MKRVICFCVIFFIVILVSSVRFIHKKVFVNKLMQDKKIDKVEVTDFTFFPFIIEQYDVKITLKNSNELIFRNINDSFCDESILVYINDYRFDFSGSYKGRKTYSSGLPISLLQCVYGKEIRDFKSFLSEYIEICTCIYNIENGKIYYDNENAPFAFAGTAMGNKEFLEEINLPFPQ